MVANVDYTNANILHQYEICNIFFDAEKCNLKYYLIFLAGFKPIVIHSVVC
jgi:hypothetical protein